MTFGEIRTSVFQALPSSIKKHLNRLENSVVRKRLVRGVTWSIFGTVVSKLLLLIASVFIARMLGKEGYGALGIIQSTVGMFSVFAVFGIGVYASKYISESRGKNQEKTGRIIAFSYVFSFSLSLLATTVLLLLAPWLASKTLNAPYLTDVLRLSAVLLFFSSVNGVQYGMLSGFEAFKAIAGINCVSALVSLPVMVAATYFLGLNGAVLGLTFSSAANVILSHRTLIIEMNKLGIPLEIWGPYKQWPALWRFILPVFLSNFIVGPMNWIANALLVNRPNGYAEMGAINAANQWYLALMFFPTILYQATFPIMSERVGAHDHTRSQKIMWALIKLNFLIITPVLLLSVISPSIMNLYGAGYADKWLTLVWTLATTWVVAVLTPIGQILTVKGYVWPLFCMNLGWAISFYVFTRVLLGYGAEGLAGARFVAYLMHAVWVIAFVIWRKRQLMGDPNPRRS